MNAIEVRLLGPPLVRLGKELLSLGPKAAALVAYLAVEGTSSRERVLGHLWPDSPQKKAQGSLRYLLHSIRKSVVDLIESDAQTLSLTEQARIDIRQLSQAVTPGQRSAAAELFRGHFCEGLQGGSPEFDDWLEKQREHWGQEVVANLLQLARLLPPKEGLKPARQALLIDPANEAAHATVIELLVKQGETAEAHRQFERCREALWQELGVEPEPSIQELLTRPVEVCFCSNLPASTTVMLGRERVGEEVLSHLAGSRLVTLTGEGGIGKTTLALEAARTLREGRNVWWVELARANDIRTLEREIAIACGSLEVAELTPHLSSSRTLLVLDNCEHLLAGISPLVSRLLKECPDLTILATSREPLRLEGEQVVPLDPLDADEACGLFIERARQAGAQTDKLFDHPGVKELCRRLDGLPLAIELAAARARSLDLPQLLAGLEQRFRFLKNRKNDAESRQQTLATLIDWSYQRLDDEEAEGFRRLSVFAGGFYSESAAEILEQDAWETADLLERLVEKSLLRTRPQGAGLRYYFLESLREFGLAKLEEGRQLPALREKHLKHFLEVARSLCPLTKGQQQRVWLDKLDSEVDNFRAALRFAAGNQPSVGLDLASALCPLWKDRDHREEGLEILKEFLDLTGPGDPEWARGLMLRGEIEIQLARCEEALPGLEEALRLGLESANLEVVGRAAKGLGTALFFLKELKRSIEFFERARSTYESLGDGFELANCINNLGLAELYLHNLERAEECFFESLELQRREGSLKGEGVAQGNLAYVAQRRGQLERSRTLFLDSLMTLQKVGALWNSAYFLEGLGRTMMDLADYDESVRCLAMAETMRLRLGTPRLRVEAEDYELMVGSLRERCPEFDSVWRDSSNSDVADFLSSQQDSELSGQNIVP